MAVDAQMMRKDLFDLITMFGPANAGGPPQANTNPGSRAPQENAQLPPPGSPPPQDPEATGSIQPQPQGARVLPPGTPIEPNVVKNPMTAQGGSPQQGPIELLPGDADPNLLPPEIRDSWMFRYEQARRAAAYKQAEEEARWANVVGGVGNIAQIISGQRPTYQQAAAHAKEPGAMDVGTLYGWKKDYDKAQQDAAAQAKYQTVIANLKRAHPEMRPEDIDAIAMDDKKLAQLGFNEADAKSIADAAKARLDVVKTSQELVPESINDPAVIKETAKALGRSEEYVKAMPLKDRIEAVKALTVSQAQGQGMPGKGFTENQVKATDEAITNAGKARNAMTSTQRALAAINDPSNKLWAGGFYGDTNVQNVASYLSGALGIDLKGITTAQELRSQVKELYAGQLKAIFGGQPSDKEGAALDQMIGADGRLNRQALDTIMRANLARQVQSQLDAQSKVEMSSKLFDDDPRSQAYLRLAKEKLAQSVPDLTQELFGQKAVDQFLASYATNPEKTIAAFDKEHGPGMGAYVLAKRGSNAQ